MRYLDVSSPLRLLFERSTIMETRINITNKDWTDFVSEVRSRLDVIDANIENAKLNNDTQHRQLREDFLAIRKELLGSSSSSMASRVRSLEDTRNKMNGVQIGISAAFSVVTAGLAWLFAHPGFHLSWQALSSRFYAMADTLVSFFRRS